MNTSHNTTAHCHSLSLPTAPNSNQHGWAIIEANAETELYIDRTKVGWGLFVGREVKAGERLLVFSGAEISLEQTLAMGHFSFYAVQIGLGRYIDVQGNPAFVNHSCGPSCSIRGTVDLVALQDLPTGTEITMDYSMSMWADPEKMECGCGSPRCRKQVVSFDELPSDFQHECINKGLVSDYIIEAMKSERHREPVTEATLPGIPTFPECTPWNLTHIKAIRAFTQKYPPYNDFCAMTLHGLDDGETLLSNLNNNLLMRFTDPTKGKRSCTLLGDNQISGSIADLLSFEASQPECQRAVLGYIPEEIAKSAPGNQWEEDRNIADYVYATEDILNASSVSLRARHRLARRFMRMHPQAKIETLDLTNSSVCAQLESFACQVMLEKGILERGLLVELRALMRCLGASSTLGCIGIGLTMENTLIGFMIVEPLGRKYYHTPFGKTRRDLAGAMEFLMIETARFMHSTGYRFHNDQEDLGLPGLRSYKMSWTPVRLLKKYRLL